MQGLKGLRRAKMLTQGELAEQVGVSLQAIQYWESGARFPRPAQQRKLCSALSIEAEQLLAVLDATNTIGSYSPPDRTRRRVATDGVSGTIGARILSRVEEAMDPAIARDWTAADLPSIMTEPCFRHFEADAQVGWTIASSGELAAYVSHLFLRWARDYLRAEPHSDGNYEASVAWQAEARTAHEVGIRSEQLNHHLLLTRAVGSFLYYISEMINIVLHADPQWLDAKGQAKYDAIKSFPDRDERTKDLIEEWVSDLTRNGMKKTQEAFAQRFDFRFFEKTEDLEAVTRMIWQRNLIVHRRARADKKFLDQMAEHTTLKRGETLTLERAPVMEQSAFLRRAVADIDTRMAAKFGLPLIVTETEFYERVKIPFFIGDWRSTFADDEQDLLEGAEDPWLDS